MRNLASALFVQHENVFVFVLHHEGVEPANNRAERAWRCAAQWRKIIFHLTGAIRAHRRRQAVASLLPQRS